MSSKYLCVDLDSTLIKTDLLIESSFRLLLKNPFNLFSYLRNFIRGKIALKEYVASKIPIVPSSLPYNNNVLSLIENYKSNNAQIILLTGSHKSYADAVAKELNLFDNVIATEKVNLTLLNKANAIKEYLKGEKYDYIGDSEKDIPTWQGAIKKYLVAKNSTSSKISNQIEFEKVFKLESNFFMSMLKQMRVHQWVKNLLVFLPILAAHVFNDLNLLCNSVKTFLSFSFVASFVYLYNDFIDLDSDRKHNEKCNRPLASGKFSSTQCFVTLSLLFVASLAVAFQVNMSTFFVILSYMVANFLYSNFGKNTAILDIFFLCFFYLARVFAGASATGILISEWLFIFIFFFFFNLSTLKRFIEVSKSKSIDSKIPGRDYTSIDTNFLLNIGMISIFAASIILALFIKEQGVTNYYSNPIYLWLAFATILYWNINIWFKGYHQKIKGDPVSYVIKDKLSLFLALIILLMGYMAK